jgi:DNA-binding NarL/FixJ family response regulator
VIDVAIVTRRTLISDTLERLLSADGQSRVTTAPPSQLQVDAAHDPTVFVLDLDDPEVQQLSLAAAGRSADDSGDRYVGFFDTFTPQHAHVAFELGVSRLVPLTASLAEMRDAVIGQERSTRVTAARGVTDVQLERLATLTHREVEVLRLLASGLTAHAVAEELGVSVRTVGAHQRKALDKLELSQLVQAVNLAVAAGIVPGMTPDRGAG